MRNVGLVCGYYGILNSSALYSGRPADGPELERGPIIRLARRWNERYGAFCGITPGRAMSGMLRWLTAVVLLAVTVVPAAAGEPAEQGTSERKVVLVLSGGGARGAAHVGVLKVLEELQVKPDLIIGTSMGSIVGGLYAAGWSPDEMVEMMAALDWNRVFSDKVPRRDQTFRRKQDDRPALIDLRVHFDGVKPYIPPGILGGQSIELLMDSLEAQSATAVDLDRLNVPFRAIATDLGSGDAVVISEATLATAMRASMAIPGVFAPVELDGRALVDGGSVANLPVGIAKDLGATHVIAVDISTPLDPSQSWDFLSVSRQMTALLTSGGRGRDVALLTEDDLLIEPDLGELSFVDFSRTVEAVELGEAGARARASDLSRFAVDDAEWAAFLDRQRQRLRGPIVIDTIRIDNGSVLGDGVIHENLSIEPNDALAPVDLSRELLELHNLRAFGVIDFRLEGEGDHRDLVVALPPPPASRGSVQLGFSFTDDFSGNSGYTLTARHQLLPVNRLGGEWQNVVQLGTVSLLDSRFYQPLDPALRWFVEPGVGFVRELADIWSDGIPVLEYEIESIEARLGAGRVLGRWGELRATAYTADDRARLRIGPPILPSDDDRRGGVRLGFRIDTIDDVVFATRGTEASISFDRSLSTFGADSETDLAHGWIEHSFSFGDTTLRPYVEYGENFDPTLDYLNLFKLGGLGRLSGLGDNELLGERVALARLIAQQRLTGFRAAGIDVQVYAGLSLEAGNVYSVDDSLTASSLLTGFSAWIGAETPLGPLFLGYGRTESRDRFYLQIGDRF